MPQIEGVAGLSFTRWDAVLELGEAGGHGWWCDFLIQCREILVVYARVLYMIGAFSLLRLERLMER
jgi:hypothetical protein